MPGLVDAAYGIARSLGVIASAARETAAELRDASRAKTENEQRSSQSSMGRAKGGAAGTMGSSSGSAANSGSMTPGSLAAALQSLTRRS